MLRNVQSVVRIDADQVGIERCVVKLGKRQTVRNDGLAQQLVLVRDDVGSVEQPLVEVADAEYIASLLLYLSSISLRAPINLKAVKPNFEPITLTIMDESEFQHAAMQLS